MMLKIISLSMAILFLNACTRVTTPSETLPLQVINSSPEVELHSWQRKIEKEEIDRSFLHPEDVSAKKLAFWLQYFTEKEKARFERFLANGEKYKDIVQNILKEYQLPQELFYLGLIESGYYTMARSHASAVGPWQFMRGTAKQFGLRVERGIDERINIFKATHAAAKYLTDLYNIFGSWELALAAYNAGENKIIRVIRQQNTRDFKTLAKRKALPRETINYIPKMLAAIEAGRNPQRYGIFIKPTTPLNYTSFEEVSFKRSLSLKKLCQNLKISWRDLKKWNPDLRHQNIYSSRRRPLKLILPTQLGQYLAANPSVSETARLKRKMASSINKSSKRMARTKRITYRVRRGDSLGKIARRFRTTVRTLKRTNHLRSNRLVIGQRLKIPTKTYTVRKGDSLAKIARKFGIRLKSLIAYNSLTKPVIFPQQKLLIP